MPDREVDGVGDETRAVRVGVQALGGLDHLRGGDRDLWPQNHLSEPATVTGLGHRARRVIDIAGDHDAGGGAQVQVPQHVAL
jgi:hypothetical protein